MNLLYVYFTLRNQQAFQRLLEGSKGASSSGTTTGGGTGQSGSNSGTVGSSYGKSWPRSKQSTTRDVHTPPLDVNAKDRLGRTVLHLACVDASALEYVKLLLAHPAINVNVLDVESHWTPLHRALYNGNIAAAMLLLQRSDVDVSLKDLEGYTAFDLYNSTVEGTKPPGDYTHADLYTWGTNRNATLGVADGNDRAYPELVPVRRPDANSSLPSDADPIAARFGTINVKEVAMSKLHTTLLTNEPRGNLRACGFGSGGRLGPAQHSLYTPTFSLPALKAYTIVAVATGQDHTLALTSTGSVLSWGMNQYSQLGYVLDGALGTGSSAPAAHGATTLQSVTAPTQALSAQQQTSSSEPRRVYGALKKEVVLGVACSRAASACWTHDAVFTWGTNNGQLGYDSVAQPVQIIPRKVTGVAEQVIGIAMSDSAMCCLLATHDIICFRNNRSSKINFPTQSFPTEIRTYRPPQAVNNASIAKITSCDGIFAALSSNGEVFTFGVPTTEDGGGKDKSATGLKPQRIWALRKQWSAVKDLALGADGSIILCTESGHVYVRSRSLKSTQTQAGGKAFQFHRIPYLQRVVKVAGNSTGAYAALKVEAVPPAVVEERRSMGEDLAKVMPFLAFPSAPGEKRDAYTASRARQVVDKDEDLEDAEQDDYDIESDVREFLRLCDFLEQDKASRKKEGEGKSLFERLDSDALPHGADLAVIVAGTFLPVHRVILATRCPALVPVFEGRTERLGDITLKLHPPRPASVPRLIITGTHSITALLLLGYLYSDRVIALWDLRIGMAVGSDKLSRLGIKPTQVKAELQVLAKGLALPALVAALEAPAKRLPAPTMNSDMRRLVEEAQKSDVRRVLAPDVVLQLADWEALCHSVILRARSPFFASFFDEREWTRKRWSNGKLTVKMDHFNWRVMEFVMQYLCAGVEEGLFDTLEFAQSPDDVIEFVFEVMSAANELLLDGLISLCSKVILRYVNLNNVAYVLSEATFYHAVPLVRSLQCYIAVSMETLLESRMIDDLAVDLVKQLGGAVRLYQAEKLPIAHSGILIEKAMADYGDWLELQDIPQPIIRTSSKGVSKDSPKLSPMGASKISHRASMSESLGESPLFKPQSPRCSPRALLEKTVENDADEMLDIECGVDTVPPFNLDQPMPQPPSPVDLPPTPAPAPTLPRSAPWKDQPGSRVAKVDLKSIMAEASSAVKPITTSTPPRVVGFEAMPGGSPSRPLQGLRRVSGPGPTSSDVTPQTTTIKLTPRDRGAPWKISAPPQANPPPRAELGVRQLPSTPPADPISQAKRHASGSASSQVTPSRGGTATPTPAGPPSQLGPVISPSRQSRKPSAPSGISMQRRTSAESQQAWVATPVQAVAAPSASRAQLSFTDIQQQQATQGVVIKESKRTLKEIQEEERAQQEEARFLEWWSAEEERVRVETEQAIAASTAPGSGAQQGQNKPKKNRPGRGRGRGLPQGKKTDTRTSNQTTH